MHFDNQLHMLDLFERFAINLSDILLFSELNIFFINIIINQFHYLIKIYLQKQKVRDEIYLTYFVESSYFLSNMILLEVN